MSDPAVPSAPSASSMPAPAVLPAPVAVKPASSPARAPTLAAKSSSFPWKLLGLVAVAGLGYWWWRKRQELASSMPPAVPPPAAPPVPRAASVSRAAPTAPVTTSVSRGASTKISASEADVYALVKSLAPEYGLDPKLVFAVIKAESDAKAVDPSTGKILIRFEPHVFARFTAAKKLGKPYAKTSTSEGVRHGVKILLPNMAEVTEGRKRRGGQAAEWDALARARAVDPEAAIMSTSFGLGQLMGFTHKTAGFATAQAMLDFFSAGVDSQVRGVCKFIAGSSKMVKALRDNNFPAFVAVYNGAPAGTANNTGYVGRMKQALSKLV